MWLAVLLLCSGPSAGDCVAMVENRRLFVEQNTCEAYVSAAERHYSSPGDRTVARCLRLAITEV